MAGPNAFVTLVSSDSYLPGALAQVAALRDVHPSPPTPPEVDFQTVCIVTPESVDVSTVRRLRKAFDLVVGVEILEQDNPAGLKLLGRPDLTTVLTKLHVFRLTQFAKVIFLDADVLPIRPISHLFSLPHEFSAVPDVGWPDIFNSGVLVLTPGEDKFEQLNQLVATKPSWDGGDQGLLNEWRGDNWNRLSFTYNTTPTAAYTYAPAYERYGSQIKAIHFIGPNKPWKSVPYRSGRQQQPSDDSVQTAYDYDSLVDRWFDVYDRHYNTIPQTPFEVKHYTAAWEQPSTEPAHPPTTLDLDQLKRLAIQGHNASKEDANPGEGTYKTLPLQGRFDLMRPRKPEQEEEDQKKPPINTKADQSLRPVDAYIQLTDVSDRFPTNAFNYEEVLSTPIARPTGLDDPRWRTLPTPGPEEIPSSPRLRLISLPNTPSPLPPLPTAAPEFAASESESESFLLAHSDSAHETRPENKPHEPHVHEQRHAQEHREQPPPQHHHHEAPRRPISPPIMSWNPALEPPPNVPPTANAFPADTYFANIWDHTPSRQNDQSHPGPSPPDSGGFFKPPPPSVIPESLIRQGHYRNVTGDSPFGATPSPDRSKIKSVFPWEDKLRVLPRRVFPDSDAPPPSLFLSPGSQSQTTEPTTPSTPETKPNANAPTRGLPLSPLYGLPNTLNYANAWDHIPSIQKYASRLVKPTLPPPSALAPAFEDDSGYGGKKGGGRKKSWDERMEVSSRDGDDEDNADDEDEEEKKNSRWDENDSDREAARKRSRRGSIVDPNVLKGKKKEYKTKGVQTVVTEKRSMGVQADPPPPPAPRPEPTTIKQESTARHSKRGFAPYRRHWAPATVSTVVAPMTTRDVSTGGHGHMLSVNTLAPTALSAALSPPEQPQQRKNSKSPSPTYGPMRAREFVVPPPNNGNGVRAGGAAVNQKAEPVLAPLMKPPMIRTSNSSTSTIVPHPSSAPGPASAPPAAPPSIGMPSYKPPSSMRVSPTAMSIARGPSNDSITRRASNDSSLGSPASSFGPLSPADSGHGSGMSIGARKGTRVWDPARGVDLFKRGSEEVLARFLKMGAWEDENRQVE